MTTSSTLLKDVGFGHEGSGETVGLRLIPRDGRRFGVVPAQGPALKQGNKDVFTIRGGANLSGVSPNRTVVRTQVENPLATWVHKVRQSALSMIGDGAKATVTVKRWEDGSPYFAVVAEAPVASVAAAMAIEEDLHDWVIESVPDMVRAVLVVSVRRSR